MCERLGVAHNSDDAGRALAVCTGSTGEITDTTAAGTRRIRLLDEHVFFKRTTPRQNFPRFQQCFLGKLYQSSCHTPKQIIMSFPCSAARFGEGGGQLDR